MLSTKFKTMVFLRILEACLTANKYSLSFGCSVGDWGGEIFLLGKLRNSVLIGLLLVIYEVMSS